jgi:hypothetical protein
VTLRWRSGDDTLRQKLEKELTELLSQVRSGPSVVSRWLRGIALVSFLALFLFTLYVQILRLKTEAF